MDTLRTNHGIETSIPQGPANQDIYHKMINTFVFKGVTVPLSLCGPNIEYNVYLAIIQHGREGRHCTFSCRLEGRSRVALLWLVV